MFTVRQRGPTIRGVFRLVKHPTSPCGHGRRIGDADIDHIPVVQGGPRQNRGHVLVLGGELHRVCRCRPRWASSAPAAPNPRARPSPPSPARRRKAGATRRPGARARPWWRASCPARRAARGPSGARGPAAGWPPRRGLRPSLLSDSHVPAEVATVKRGVSSVTAMWTPSGHETCTVAERTHGSCSRRAAAAPAFTSSSGGWLANPAWATTWAAVSCTLPVTDTERAEKSAVWTRNHPPTSSVTVPSATPSTTSRRRPCSLRTAVRRAEMRGSIRRRVAPPWPGDGPFAPAVSSGVIAPPRPVPRRTRHRSRPPGHCSRHRNRGGGPRRAT